MIRLGKINNKEVGKQNEMKILDYVEENLEVTISSALYLLGANNADNDSQEDSESKEDTLNADVFYGSKKLQVRAQNFKKFRQSTQQLI